MTEEIVTEVTTEEVTPVEATPEVEVEAETPAAV